MNKFRFRISRKRRWGHCRLESHVNRRTFGKQYVYETGSKHASLLDYTIEKQTEVNTIGLKLGLQYSYSIEQFMNMTL